MGRSGNSYKSEKIMDIFAVFHLATFFEMSKIVGSCDEKFEQVYGKLFTFSDKHCRII